MDSELFEYCKEAGIPEDYAQQSEFIIRMSFDFQAWRLSKAWKKLADIWYEECISKPLKWIHSKLKR